MAMTAKNVMDYVIRTYENRDAVVAAFNGWFAGWCVVVEGGEHRDMELPQWLGGVLCGFYYNGNSSVCRSLFS